MDEANATHVLHPRILSVYLSDLKYKRVQDGSDSRTRNQHRRNVHLRKKSQSGIPSKKVHEPNVAQKIEHLRSFLATKLE